MDCAHSFSDTTKQTFFFSTTLSWYSSSKGLNHKYAQKCSLPFHGKSVFLLQLLSILNNLSVSLMALIPAGVVAGGPVHAFLLIFPVIKQTVAQDSVHAKYVAWRLVCFWFLLKWPPRYRIMLLTCTVKKHPCSSRTASWKYWHSCRNKLKPISRRSSQT